MPASDVLIANIASTRFPSLSVDVTLTTSVPGGAQFTARSRTLARFEAASADRWKFDIMSRVTAGQPTNGRFLIEQRSGSSPWPLTWVRDPVRGNARRYAFQPWQPFPLSASRWMDYILPPPGTYTASLNPAATPSDPGWAPPAACDIVDLTLSPSFWIPEPRLARVWIEQTPGRAVDHRVEQHLSDGSVRTIVSTGWAQLKAGGPWAPASRVIDDPQLGTRTTMVVTSADPNSLDAHLFNPVAMADESW